MAIPCTDLELERRFVATKLAFSNSIATPDLLPDHLCSTKLREVYKAMLYLDANEDGWNIDSVINFLESEGKLDRVVTKGDLIEISLSKNDVDYNIKPMVEQLRRLARARVKRDVLRSAVDALESSEYEKADQEIMAAADSVVNDSDNRIYSAHDLAQTTKAVLKSLGDGERMVIPTGIKYLDNSVGGLLQGGMFTIAGYTSTCKSQLALLISMNVARSGDPAGILMVEDSPALTGSRVISNITRTISSRNLLTGEYTLERSRSIIEEIDTWNESFRKLKLYAAHCTEATPTDIMDNALRLIKEKQCKIIVLDYLQRIRVNLKIARYDKTISDVAKQLKSLCARYGVALILISQLTRPRDGTIYKKPHPNQLKESGDLENESEVIILLWDESDMPDSRKLFWVPKVKWGGAGLHGRLIRNTTTGMIEDMGEYTNEKKSQATEERNNYVRGNYCETRRDYE